MSLHDEGIFRQKGHEAIDLLVNLHTFHRYDDKDTELASLLISLLY